MAIWQLGAVDDRGRELQQVGMGSRFWWRALDAQSPEPVTPRPPVRIFHRSLRAQAAAPANTALKLQIPLGDRRRLRKTKTKHSPLALLTAVIVAGLGATSAIAFTLSDMTLTEARSSVAEVSARVMIGAGFGIDQLSLTGQRYTLDSDVFDALDLTNVRTFAALDTAAALKRIERISWVETAQITRVFPGMLNIEIKERTPAAIWRRGDKNILIDATGRTLGPVPHATNWALPHVAGEGASSDAPLLLAALSTHKDIASRLSYAERIAERRWSIALNSGSRIELGADREIEGLNYVTSNAALRKALSGPPVTIDVRTPGRAIVRPSAISAAHVAKPALSQSKGDQ